MKYATFYFKYFTKYHGKNEVQNLNIDKLQRVFFNRFMKNQVIKMNKNEL